MRPLQCNQPSPAARSALGGQTLGDRVDVALQHLVVGLSLGTLVLYGVDASYKGSQRFLQLEDVPFLAGHVRENVSQSH